MIMKLIRPVLLSAAVALTGAAAVAQDNFPSKTIRIVVPYSAGGPADLLARSVAEKLSPRLGQPVIIDNRGGAGGHTGADHVARSDPDGYTLMLGTIAHHGAYTLYKDLRYDPTTDLKTIAVIAEAPSILVVHPDVPIKTVQDLLDAARKAPGTLTYGSAGVGSAMHMAAELFRHMTKIDYTHVPYKGGAPAMADLLGGQIHMLFESLGTAHPHIRAGKIRPIAVTGTSRSASLPDVPTVAESGVEGYSSLPWYTIAAPKDVPEAIINKLNTEINAVLRDPELVERWAGIGFMPVGGSPADAAARNATEAKKWTEVIKAANITLQ